MKLRSARGGASFSRAWDAALAIYAERNKAVERERTKGRLINPVVTDRRRLSEEDERELEEQRKQVEEVQARNRDRFLRARRLYLLTLCMDEEKQKAWETLCGPVDWELAVEIKPQPNEPYPVRLVESDMTPALRTPFIAADRRRRVLAGDGRVRTGSRAGVCGGVSGGAGDEGGGAGGAAVF